MNKYHEVGGLRFDAQAMELVIDGKLHRFELSEVSARLRQADAREREQYRIAPSGYGIHWPLLDEDISVDGLLGIVHQPAQARKTA